MNKAPIFLAAFANNSAAWLHALSEEESQLRNTLAPLHDQHRIEYLSIGSTSVDDIYRNFNRYHNRIIAFHFAGHSNASVLELVDQQHRATNLATLMGMQKYLHLVVLNGCANKAQVKGLLEAGVKVVVATSVGIQDIMATVFSGQFYGALVSGKTIEEAFKTATGYLEEKHQINKAAAQVRDIGFAQGDEPMVPWELYSIDANDLRWTLPEARFTKEAVADFKKYQEEVEIRHLQSVNQNLLLSTVTGLAKYRSLIYATLDLYQQNPDPELYNDLQNKMIDAFLSPIAIQIRDLFTDEVCTYGRLRLNKLNEVFLSITQLLAAIALANLWEESLDKTSLQPNPNFIIRPEYKNDLREYLNLTKEKAPHFDYIWLLATVQRILVDNNTIPFLKELSQLSDTLEKDTTTYEAYRFLEQELRQRLLQQDIEKQEVAPLCQEAETHLGIVLQTCSFLSAYQFISIKDISVRKRRGSLEPSFIHKKTTLRGRDLATVDKEPIIRRQFTDDRSMLVSRNLNTEDALFLNLSPFLMDLNAFSVNGHQTARLYIYHHRNEQQQPVYQDTQVMDTFFTVEAADISTEYKELNLLTDLLTSFEKNLNL